LQCGCEGSKVVTYILVEALILDVGLLTIVGVNCKANDQQGHSQAISYSPTPR
jgi:hypothetical protein